MAKEFLTDINLSKNELLNAVMHNLTTAPLNPKTGQLYYNTNDKMMYQWDGSAWKPVGSIYTNGNGIVISSSNVVSANFATTDEAETGTSNTKVMSPALVKAVIEALDVTAFAVASVNADGDTITIQGLKETDGKIGTDANNKLTIKIDPINVYDPTINPLATIGTVNNAVGTKTVTVEKLATAETGYLSTYVVKQNGSQVGASINIPKDFLVRSGNVIDVVEYEGNYYNATDTNHTTQLPVSSAGKYVDFVINVHSGTATDEHIYLNVADLVDVYTAGAGIDITNGNVVKAKMVRETNESLASETPSNTEGRQYPVVPDSNGNLSVNVPWYNTLYTNAALGHGLITARNDVGETDITVAFSGYQLITGGILSIGFRRDVPAGATLNINNQGAKEIYYKGLALTNGIIKSGDRCLFMYSATAPGYYHLLAIDRWGVDIDSLADVARTGSYNDLIDKPGNVDFGHGYAICPTAAATAAKIAALTDYKLTTGGIVAVKFTYAVPANATLNINSKGAIPIYYKGAAVTANIIKAGDTATLMYDDTKYHLLAIDHPTIEEATTSAAGLMSAADKTKLDGMTYLVKRFSVTNPALTSAQGMCTWTIGSSSVGNASDLRDAMCSLRDSNGYEVFADVRYTQASIIITINASANIEASTYTANILIPVNL